MSSNRDSVDQSNHDRKIREVAGYYMALGYSVQADHIEGYECPEKINKHIPDILATRDGKVIIVEVETEKSVESEHAFEQKLAFEDYARSRVGVYTQYEMA